MAFWLLTICAVVLATASVSAESAGEEKSDTQLSFRGALLVTLAGDHKLAPYFEWSCRTFGASHELYDMLVFHEDNKNVPNLRCPENVKFVDLGPKGLSKMVVDKVLEGTTLKDSVKDRVKTMVDDIINHNPRYLVEIKPMLGSLFQAYLHAYTHWSYTDPDIIWGNLIDALDISDLQQYDIVSVAKNSDSGRLFLRGQLTFHQNTQSMNDLWKQLPYFSYEKYAERIANAHHMLEQKQSSDAIFSQNFHSAEGWYSQVVFKSGATVKIIGRGFDDFYRHPVVYLQGELYRCSVNTNITTCLQTLNAFPSGNKQQQQQHTQGEGATTASAVATVGAANSSTGSSSVFSALPPMKLVDAQASYEPSKCKMFWLPVETRYCIATEVYDKDSSRDSSNSGAAGGGSKPNMKLTRVGEAVLDGGKWFINDEAKSRRQFSTHAALFHFRHWDDYISTAISTTWGRSKEATDDPDLMTCMVLYLRRDGAMAFESCDVVYEKEAVGFNLLLRDTPNSAGSAASANAGEDVGKVLQRQRKQREVGGGAAGDWGSGSITGRSGGSSSGGGSSITSLEERARRTHLRQRRPLPPAGAAPVSDTAAAGGAAAQYGTAVEEGGDPNGTHEGTDLHLSGNQAQKRRGKRKPMTPERMEKLMRRQQENQHLSAEELQKKKRAKIARTRKRKQDPQS